MGFLRPCFNSRSSINPYRVVLARIGSCAMTQTTVWLLETTMPTRASFQEGTTTAGTAAPCAHLGTDTSKSARLWPCGQRNGARLLFEHYSALGNTDPDK